LAWRDAIVRHPVAYLRHRAHVFSKTIGVKVRREIDGSADEPIRFAFRDNPRAEILNPEANAIARRWIERLKPQWWASPLVWTLVATLACLALWARTFAQRDANETVPRFSSVLVWLSAMCYLIPLFFLLPSAEMRYVLWPTLACVLALALACAAPPRVGCAASFELDEA
jgi:hypothetical protein